MLTTMGYFPLYINSEKYSEYEDLVLHHSIIYSLYFTVRLPEKNSSPIKIQKESESFMIFFKYHLSDNTDLAQYQFFLRV